MKNRAVCRALVCALSLTLVAPPTIGQQYIDPLTQRFDQQASTAATVAQTNIAAPVPLASVDQDTHPDRGARIAGLHTFGSREEQQSKANQAEASKLAAGAVPAAAALVAALIIALTDYRSRRKNHDFLLFTTGTTGTTGTR